MTHTIQDRRPVGVERGGLLPVEAALALRPATVLPLNPAQERGGVGGLGANEILSDLASLKKEIEMFNKAFLLGNLGRDPEVRSATSGATIVNFSLATNRRYTDSEGERREQTQWHNIVCFGRQAEIAAQYLTCGRQVFLEGRIQTRSWQDRESGEKRYRTEVVCQNFQMLGPRGEARDEVTDPATDEPPEIEDTDVPF